MSIPMKSAFHQPNYCVIDGRLLGEWRGGWLYIYNSRGNAVFVGIPSTAAKR